MTTTIATSATTTSGAATSAATWALVSEGLWAGTRDGEFLGTIEFIHGRFEVADHHGTGLGRSHSLAGAKRMLDCADPEEVEQVLRWSDQRSLLVLGWLAFGASAIAAVSIATQLFV